MELTSIYKHVFRVRIHLVIWVWLLSESPWRLSSLENVYLILAIEKDAQISNSVVLLW